MKADAPTKERIRDAALRLFVERGVAAVSVRDIAAEVGMKPSNLYSHFPSKDALVRELITAGYAAYGARLDAVARGPGPFARRLDAMVRLICRLHDEDTDRFRFLLLAQHTELARLGDEVSTPVAIVQREVDAAMRAGELPPGDPALLTAMLVGIPVQAATFSLYGRLDRPLCEAADALAAACLAVLRSAPPGDAP